MGNDLGPSIKPISHSDCCVQCSNNKQCNAFTWRQDRQECWLKSSMGNGGRYDSNTATAYRSSKKQIKDISVFFRYFEGEGKSGDHYHDFILAKELFRRLRPNACSDDRREHKQSTRSNYKLEIPKEFKNRTDVRMLGVSRANTIMISFLLDDCSNRAA